MTALNPTSVGEKSLRHADPPLATYRLQFGGDLTFANASRLVPYLDQLGVSHIYASPYVAARPGSLHGYDVANPNSLNPEIGSETEYRALAHELARHGMSQVLDWVPNHMAIGYGSNAWWQDVMEKGPSSIYAAMFDIDWSSGDATWGQTGAAGKVILPVLGDHYGRVLERGELSLAYEAGELQLRYYAYILPIALRSYLGLLTGVKKALEDQRPGDRKLLTALGETIALFKRISDGPARSLPGRTLRFRRTQQAKLRLRSLYQTSETFRVMLDAKLASVNGERGRPASFDSLDEILNQQWYRLAHWRVAAEEINYRRFFDINELVALRMENEEVFRATHHLFLQLLRTGAISGVRIDHIDGLRDPAGHLWRLQKTAFVELNKYRLSEPAGGRQRSVEEAASQLAAQFDRERKANPHSAILRPLWVVVEKILSETEWLRESWPVHGTTGYEFMNQLNGIFVNRANGPAMERVYFRFIGSRPDYREVVNSAKKTVMLISFPGEINRLAARLKRVAAADRSSRDFTLNGLTFAIRELIAALPVYRTYMDTTTGEMQDADRAIVRRAIDEAKRRNPRTDPSLFEFVHDAVTLQGRSPADPSYQELLEFNARLQQTSGPVCAKGVEDTAFYVYNRLISLNEVGGAPDKFGTSLTSFHRQNQLRQRRWPNGLIATSTHDSKRSEDVRARINVLSEMPGEWGSALARWSRLNARHKTVVDGRPAPARNDEYLLYQTLLGAWPLRAVSPGRDDDFVRRMQAFMEKATREAKVYTSWINQNAPYEEATRQFVAAILADGEQNAFLQDFAVLQRKVAHFGMLNSLSQTLLKLAAPGVPDIYQGNELWDFSLVDPDNRRPVDFSLRARTLQKIERLHRAHPPALRDLACSLLQAPEDGAVKLFLTHACLIARRQHPALFRDSAYAPLRSTGSKRAHICSFARWLGEETVIAVAPVLVAGLLKGRPGLPLGEVWGDTSLPLPNPRGGVYRNLLTNEAVETTPLSGKGVRLPLSQVLQSFPVALLLRAA